MTDKPEYCYSCFRVATSREHVPPRCIFPERKDTSGADLRKNLITVPSCDIHNLGKSKDDEFLMISIAGVVGNNFNGYRHNQTKVSRALKRTSFKFLSKVLKNKKHIKIDGDKNRFLDVIVGTPDAQRLYQCFEQVARGIFYQEFQQTFTGKLRLVMGFLRYVEKDNETFRGLVKHRFEVDPEIGQKQGGNPDVFYYQLIKPDEFGLIAMKHCFYGGVDVYVSFQPNDSREPFNLGMMFVNAGMQTHIRIGDQDYHFNRS